MDPLIISAGISALGGLFSAKSAEKAQASANQQTAQSAREQMEFQREMSNTAHQREVRDLEAAGLNPILSANAGASTPGGAMSNFQSTKANTPERVLASAKTVSDALINKANVANTNEQTRTQRTQQISNIASAGQATSSAKLADANARLVEAQLPEKEARGNVYKSKYGKALPYVSETLDAIGAPLGAFTGGFLGSSAKSIVRNIGKRRSRPSLDYTNNSYKG